jgi:hypothetical protein
MQRPNLPKTENARQVKSKVKSMLFIFFNMKRIVHEEFMLVAKQEIPHTSDKFYGDCVNVCEHFSPNFGNKRTGCCITTTDRLTLPLSPGNV